MNATEDNDTNTRISQGLQNILDELKTDIVHLFTCSMTQNACVELIKPVITKDGEQEYWKLTLQEVTDVTPMIEYKTTNYLIRRTYSYITQKPYKYVRNINRAMTNFT